MNSYTATEAKRYFGQILDECLFEKKAIPVKRHGKIIAYVVPSDKWIDSTKDHEGVPLLVLEEIYELRNKYKNKKSKPFDTIKVIKDIRDERVKKTMTVLKRGI